MSASIEPMGSPFRQHLPHGAQDYCPMCDQPVTRDRVAEIEARQRERDDRQTQEITIRLREQATRETADAVRKVREEQDARFAQEQQAAVSRQAEAVNAERIRVEKAQEERLTEITRSGREELEQLQRQLVDSRQGSQALKEQLQQKDQEKAEALRCAQIDTEAKISAAREEATKVAQAALRNQVTAEQQARANAEGKLREMQSERDQAQTATKQLAEQFEQQQKDQAAARQQEREQHEEQIRLAREEAATVAQAAIQAKVTEAETAKTAAEQKAILAEDQLKKLQESQDEAIRERLKEQQEALADAHTKEVNKLQQSHFEQNQSLQDTVNKLNRELERKTNEELGEGAEIDLFEDLKASFPDDRVTRIAKGLPGADIRHIVMHNGKEVGTVLYDSKNHMAWRNDFVTKLAADKLADRAEHAILSTSKFPAGKKHLCMQDSVLVASPARIIDLVTMIRSHMIRIHVLQLSNEERAQKTDALYEFITSQRYIDQLSLIESSTSALLELQEKEMRAHKLNWEKQGTYIMNVVRAQSEIGVQIESIIGGSDLSSDQASANA